MVLRSFGPSSGSSSASSSLESVSPPEQSGSSSSSGSDSSSSGHGLPAFLSASRSALPSSVGGGFGGFVFFFFSTDQQPDGFSPSPLRASSVTSASSDSCRAPWRTSPPSGTLRPSSAERMSLMTKSWATLTRYGSALPPRPKVSSARCISSWATTNMRSGSGVSAKTLGFTSMRPVEPIAATDFLRLTLMRTVWHSPARCGRLADTSLSALRALARASASGVGGAGVGGGVVMSPVPSRP